MGGYIQTIPDNENNFELRIFVKYYNHCVLCIVVWLLLTYELFSRTLKSILQQTKIPKLYRSATVQSLWIGFLNLLIFLLCFAQLDELVCPFIKDSEQFIVLKAVYAATARFCESCKDGNPSQINTTNYCQNTEPNKIPEWTVFNAVSVAFISAILIQQILLGIRNKNNFLFYSNLLGLVFINVAVRTRCPILSVQGAFLISANVSSRELIRASVAWKSYTQEDSDSRPSLPMKTGTTILFLFHIVLWLSCILYFLPNFLHQSPPVCERGQDRLFLAYTYLAMLGYLFVEIALSPLWTTLRCMAWCRRGSGLLWRTLALSDCHLLGHYSPLLLELHSIQTVLDREKAVHRRNIISKHLRVLERGRGSPKTSTSRNPTHFVSTVKTLMALKKKIVRHQQSKEVHGTLSRGHVPHVTVKPEESYLPVPMKLDNSAASLFEFEGVNGKRQQSTNITPGASHASDRTNVPRPKNTKLVKRSSKNVQVKVAADAPLNADSIARDDNEEEGEDEGEEGFYVETEVLV